MNTIINYWLWKLLKIDEIINEWLSVIPLNLPAHNFELMVIGGGGIVLSRAAVELLALPGRCRCPQADTPDDMWLGACAENLHIDIVHFPGFHQVISFLHFPEVYALKNDKNITMFHKKKQRNMLLKPS